MLRQTRSAPFGGPMSVMTLAVLSLPLMLVSPALAGKSRVLPDPFDGTIRNSVPPSGTTAVAAKVAQAVGDEAIRTRPAPRAIGKSPASTQPTDSPEPMSERAAAAAARAARALADEDSEDFDGGIAVDADLVAPDGATGQPVVAGDRRQKSASAARPAAKCVAGC